MDKKSLPRKFQHYDFEDKNIGVYTGVSCLSNPGLCAWGYVVVQYGTVIARDAGAFGRTLPYMQWHAIHQGLLAAHKLSGKRLVYVRDQNLVRFASKQALPARQVSYYQLCSCVYWMGKHADIQYIWSPRNTDRFQIQAHKAANDKLPSSYALSNIG